MIEKLRINRPWRFGGRLYHTGLYRVPKDIVESIARQAVADGAARVEKEYVDNNTGSFVVDDPVEEEPEAQPSIKKTGRKKRPSPENKHLGPAPENKSSLD